MAVKESKLYVNMLGGCSLTYNGKTINDQTVRSKKFWLLIEYLIVFRNRDISQSELIDLIYPEGKSENPGNALKTLMHRIRNALAELEYFEGHEMIIQSRGTYAWNSNMDCVIDVEEFEEYCNKGKAPWISEEERLDCLLSAIDIYKGDFLHKSALEPWAVQFNVYYHSLYGDIVHKAIDMLKQRGNNDKIIEICRKAIIIDAFDEFLYYNLIRGLISINNLQAALLEYRKMSTLFYREFGINPSKEITALYKEIIKTSKKVETDLDVISENLEEDAPGRGAYYCEYEVFKDIYRLEIRTKPRTGESVYLSLVTLTTTKGEVPSVKMLNSFMDKLNECIKKTLRKGDIFAQYSVSQYILLLPFTTYENGEMVMTKIIKAFHRQYPYCPLTIVHSIKLLEEHPK
ncbi:MAG: SARP family transcriptional regulator [Clostridiales bacterium]|nr:SARP family transcriptional regulator [Clostridiales bacterium]